MRIAIIDSGVELSHKRLRNSKISGVSLNENENKIIYSNEFIDELGHGTGIAGIIHGSVPDAELVAVKIFHKELKATEKLVCAAINWCINNNIDIINLSLGLASKTPGHELHKVCVECYYKKIIIIAAAHHTGIECYPAYFPEVFGVSAGTIRNRYDYGFIPDSPIEFLAKGNVQRVATINNGLKITDGTSYACANFTGIVSRVLADGVGNNTYAEIKKCLIKNANSNVQPLYKTNPSRDEPIIISNDLVSICEKWIDREKRLNWLGRIAVFPASEKEMSSFIKLPYQSKYSLTCYFDYPKTFDEPESNTFILKELPSADDLTKFDSLVVGYFHENLFPSNVNFGKELINRVMSSKNLFIYDKNVYYDINKEKNNKNINIYCPIVTKEIVEEINAFRFHENIKTPVLAVIGTSNRQGKFTTQLRIKEILTLEGYKISHLSTEPQGELFGADFSFPIGHNLTVELPFDDWPLFLRSLTKAMEYYLKPDLILTGTQGWVVPRSFSYPDSNIFNAMQYINGVQPDALVCAINPNDTLDIIIKNVEAAKSVSMAKLVFVTMTPWLREFKDTGNSIIADYKFLSKEEMEKKLAYYSKELQVPVIDILDKSNDKLILETINEFYS